MELEQRDRNALYLLFQAVWVLPGLEIVRGVVWSTLRYSGCSADISPSPLCEAEAEVGSSEMQTPVAPTKVKRGESVLPSNTEEEQRRGFAFSRRGKKLWF